MLAAFAVPVHQAASNAGARAYLSRPGADGARGLGDGLLARAAAAVPLAGALLLRGAALFPPDGAARSAMAERAANTGVGMVLHLACIRACGTGAAAAVSGTAALWAFPLAYFSLGENPSPTSLAAALMGFVGLALLAADGGGTAGGNGTWLVGLACGLFASLFFAQQQVQARKVLRKEGGAPAVSAEHLALAASIGQAAVGFPLSIWSHWATLRAGSVPLLLRSLCGDFIDLASAGICAFSAAYSTALRARVAVRLPASTVLTIGSLNVLLAYIFEIAWAGRPPGAREAMGSALLVTGVLVAAAEGRVGQWAARITTGITARRGPWKKRAAVAASLAAAAIAVVRTAEPPRLPAGDELVSLAGRLLLARDALDAGWADRPLMPLATDQAREWRRQWEEDDGLSDFDPGEMERVGEALARNRNASAEAKEQLVRQQAYLDERFPPGQPPNPLMPGCRLAAGGASPENPAQCDLAPVVRQRRAPYARALHAAVFVDRSAYLLGLAALIRSLVEAASKTAYRPEGGQPMSLAPKFFIGFDGDPEEMLGYLSCLGLLSPDEAAAAQRSSFPYVGPDIPLFSDPPAAADLPTISAGRFLIRKIPPATSLLAPAGLDASRRHLSNPASAARAFPLLLFPELGCEAPLLADADSIFLSDPSSDIEPPGMEEHRLPNTDADPTGPIPALLRAGAAQGTVPFHGLTGAYLPPRFLRRLALALRMLPFPGGDAVQLPLLPLSNSGIAFHSSCHARVLRGEARAAALLALHRAAPLWPGIAAWGVAVRAAYAPGWAPVPHHWNVGAVGKRTRPRSMAGEVIGAGALHWTYGRKPWEGMLGKSERVGEGEVIGEGGERLKVVSEGLEFVWERFAGDKGVLGRCYATVADRNE
ncbi:hypothetical protein DFJ74DRAFT_741435 [Hyaloraphidium curvatum]|nr:hypothetical protein DFJ74DRAFT_741435 [Hyaloraphidium curvatum]